MTLAGYITKDDLYVAYRKAKVDAFFERDHPTALAFSAYERKLDSNLKNLFALLTAKKATWHEDMAVVGRHSYIPKSLDAAPPHPNFIDSEADLPTGSKPRTTLRMVGVHPPNFHVITSLWLMKIGHKFDSVLGACAYGSRIRRAAQNDPPPDVALGNFSAYPRGFRRWRSDGIAAMRDGLKGKRRVVSVTADLRRFYHEVDPSFLTHPAFLKRHERSFKLIPAELEFTTCIVAALRNWAHHADKSDRGIPVGLPISRLIANVILEEFDSFVETELAPLYYGRYVDDVFLVLSGIQKPKSSDAVWEYICAQSSGLVQPVTEPGEEQHAYRINLPYGGTSNLRFAGAKQKVFSLKGARGLALLKAITTTITETSSDWRLLPDLQEHEDSVVADVITGSSDAAEEADNLRKSDGLTVRRLAFSIKVRNFEAVERHLPEAKWRKFRHSFLRMVIDTVITVPGVFTYYPYIPRLVGLAISCGDHAIAAELLKKLRETLGKVSALTEVDQDELTKCSHRLFESCVEAVCMALKPGTNPSVELQTVIQALHDGANATFGEFNPDTISLFFLSLDGAIAYGAELFFADLGRVPWREVFLDSFRVNAREELAAPMVEPTPELAERLRVGPLKDFFSEIAPAQLGPALPIALVFPTRPFTLAEITRISPKWLQASEKLADWLQALRGVFPSKKSLSNMPRLKDNVLTVPSSLRGDRAPLVAVPCFLTKQESWVANVSGHPDPDSNRFFRLNRVVNHLLEDPLRADYLVLPECSLPREWFDWFAHRLAQSGISLIAGVEYRHWRDSARKYVSNEVRISLVTDFLGYPDHISYTQEKATPALHEEHDLHQLAGLVLKPTDTNKYVIEHGGFRFATLICSELTNVLHRGALRGRVDALFVPEWNSDLETFSPIVEASASDLHCYVVQANNRLYGDCRVRAPFKQQYQRDIARIRGGEADYFVVAKLDVKALRSFQSGHRSPLNGLFKPVPDGFVIDDARKCMPTT